MIELKIDKEVPKMTPERVEQLVRYVLAERFPGEPMRQEVLRRGNRLSMCCPYCGDSMDPHKKRGNMYTNWLSFKCYNGGCDKYTDLEWFLRNHDQIWRLSDEELTSMKIHIQDNQKNFGRDRQETFGANLHLLVEAEWDRLLVRRSDIMKKMRLWDIRDTSPQGVYLTKRMQRVDEKFAWDPNRKRMFVFNLDKTGEFVFGLQTKQMDDPSAKYKTYTIEKVHEYFTSGATPGLLEYASRYNRLSTIFGILRANIYADITIFEGPMDHFLYPNSVATCGIDGDWPLDLGNTRWFQDNDQAGVKKAIQMLEQGRRVFMWRRMLDENPHLYGSKRKDYNDIFINGQLAGRPPGTLDQYFTDHKLDAIYL